MKLSKKISLALVGTIVLTNLGLTKVFANNSSDTRWQLPWSYINKSHVLTEERAKTDSTSGYGNILKGNEDVNYGMSMQLKRPNGGDLVGRYRVLPAVYFGKNEEHYIQSNAYENGYRGVSMYIQKYRPNGCGAANGLWSPDSY